MAMAIEGAPTSLTRLIGREREINEDRAPLDQEGVCLVTLTGLGSVGKTRLDLVASSLDSARGQPTDFPW
jgi:hypothetical protein